MHEFPPPRAAAVRTRHPPRNLLLPRLRANLGAQHGRLTRAAPGRIGQIRGTRQRIFLSRGSIAHMLCSRHADPAMPCVRSGNAARSGPTPTPAELAGELLPLWKVRPHLDSGQKRPDANRTRHAAPPNG
jgi:hypothetical protein